MAAALSRQEFWEVQRIAHLQNYRSAQQRLVRAVKMMRERPVRTAMTETGPPVWTLEDRHALNALSNSAADVLRAGETYRDFMVRYEEAQASFARLRQAGVEHQARKRAREQARDSSPE